MTVVIWVIYAEVTWSEAGEEDRENPGGGMGRNGPALESGGHSEMSTQWYKLPAETALVF